MGSREEEREADVVLVGYDSDDPEAWGPYYWSDEARRESAGAAERAWDAAKYAAFKSYRAMDFAGLVLLDFFGLNQSRYQWVLDAAEREKRQKEQEELEESQREELRRAQREKEETAQLGELEGGS